MSEHGQKSSASNFDLSISFQAGQETTKETIDQFEVLQAGIPAIETDTFRAEPTLIGDRHHRLEMIILGQTVFGLVVDPVINRDVSLTIRPQQSH